MKAPHKFSIGCAGVFLLILVLNSPANAECTVRDDGTVLTNGAPYPGVWIPANCGPFPADHFIADNVAACEDSPNRGQRRIFFKDGKMIAVDSPIDTGNLCPNDKMRQWSGIISRPGMASRGPDRGYDPTTPEPMQFVESRNLSTGAIGENIRGCRWDPVRSDRLFVDVYNSQTRAVKNEQYAVEECARLGYTLPPRGQAPGVAGTPNNSGNGQGATQPPPRKPQFVSQSLATNCIATQAAGSNQELGLYYTQMINRCGQPVTVTWAAFDNGSPQTGAGAGVGHSGCLPPGGSFTTTFRRTLGATSETRATRVMTCQ